MLQPIIDMLADPLVAEALGVGSSEVSLDVLFGLSPEDTSSDAESDADLIELADLGLIGESAPDQQAAMADAGADSGEIQTGLYTTDPAKEDEMLVV